MRIKFILTLFFYLALTNSAFGSSLDSCTQPNPVAKDLFELIESPKTSLAQIKAFMQTPSNVVAVDALNKDCKAPLMVSLELHKDEIFRYLFTLYNPNPNVDIVTASFHAFPSLYVFAIENGDWQTIDFLKHNGGKVAKDKNELTIALYAKRDIGIIRKIINRNKKNLNIIGSYPPICVASRFYGEAVMRLLIDSGVEINVHCEYSTQFGEKYIKDDQNRPIHIASYYGNMEAVKVLIENGVDINVTNGLDYTPLMIASRDQGIPFLGYLIQNGANVNYEASGNEFTKKGMTALILAITENTLKVVEFLIRSGASVNSDDDVSPLIYAIINNKEAIVKILIRSGALVNPRRVRFTPFTYAAAYNRLEIAKLLVSSGADTHDRGLYYGSIPLGQALRSNLTELDMFEYLFSEGLGLGTFSDYDISALYLLFADGLPPERQTTVIPVKIKQLPDIVSLLVSHGAKINIEDPKGYRSPIIALLKNKKFRFNLSSVVYKLIELGLDLNKTFEYVSVGDGQQASNIKAYQLAKITGWPQEVVNLLTPDIDKNIPIASSPSEDGKKGGPERHLDNNWTSDNEYWWMR